MDFFPVKGSPDKISAKLSPIEAEVISAVFTEKNLDRISHQFDTVAFDEQEVRMHDPRGACQLPSLTTSNLEYMESALDEFADNTPAQAAAIRGDDPDLVFEELAQWRQDAAPIARRLRDECAGARMAYSSDLHAQIATQLEIESMEAGYFKPEDLLGRPAIES